MSEIVVLVKEILACPECIKKKKIRRFSNSSKGIQSLNIHLRMKHNANYKLEGQLRYIPRIS